MQAVADALGVDRKTINHHVRDLGQLRRLVALSALSEAAGTYAAPSARTWEEAVRAFASALLDALLPLGEHARHLRVDADLVVRLAPLSEALAERLHVAGFTDEAVVRALALTSTLVLGLARDQMPHDPLEDPVRIDALRAALDQLPAEGFPRLRQVARTPVDTYAREQADLAVEVLIAGLRVLGPSAGPRPSP